jgi:DNA-binding response OmpR family regulator
MQALLYCPHADEGALLSLVLQQTGFAVRSIRTMEQALDQWPQKPSELIMLVVTDEFPQFLHALKELRAQTLTNIVIITGPIPEDRHVEWLENGADLVICKPYSNRILNAEIRALLRRTAGMPFFSLPILTQSGLVLDPSLRTIRVNDGHAVHLTQLEFRLIFTLMTHAGQIIPNANIVEHVWGYSGEGNQELVRGLVKRLRSKIEPDPKNPKFVLTEPGIGYYFNRFTDRGM